MREGDRYVEDLSEKARAALSLVGALAVVILCGCGAPAAGEHSYIYEDAESVRYVEWDGEEGALSGSVEGIVYGGPEEGVEEYAYGVSGSAEGATVRLDSTDPDLSYTGEVVGGELRVRWTGEAEGSRTYEEGSREDYEAARAEFENNIQSRIAADQALAGAEEVVFDDLSGFAGRVDPSIGGTIAAVREHKEEIEAVPAANEEELAEQRALASEISEDYDEPRICTEGTEPTYLESESLYEPDEAYEWWDVGLFEGQLEEKREAIADAEEELAGLDEVPEGAEERLAGMEARVEEDAESVAELKGLVKETNEAYRTGARENQEVMEKYDRLLDEADCIPD